MSELVRSSLVNIIKLLESDMSKEKILKDPAVMVANMALAREGKDDNGEAIAEFKLTDAETEMLRMFMPSSDKEGDIRSPIFPSLRRMKLVEVGQVYKETIWGSGAIDRHLQPYMPVRVTALGHAYINKAEEPAQCLYKHEYKHEPSY